MISETLTLGLVSAMAAPACVNTPDDDRIYFPGTKATNDLPQSIKVRRRYRKSFLLQFKTIIVSKDFMY